MGSAAADWINRCPSLVVCGIADSVSAAFQAVQQLRPDVVVSEIMRQRDVHFIRNLHRLHPRLPILVFSIHEEAEFGALARQAGASGYLMKEAGGDELVRCIRAVLRKRMDRHPAGQKTFRHFAEPSKPPAEVHCARSRLREVCHSR
jgi:DNA-binding NarL/FixJ family response regulator